MFHGRVIFMHDFGTVKQTLKEGSSDSFARLFNILADGVLDAIIEEAGAMSLCIVRSNQDSFDTIIKLEIRNCSLVDVETDTNS